MLWPDSSKIGQSKGWGGGGGVLLRLSHRDVSSFENEKFSSAWKLLKLTWGSILGHKNDSRHKKLISNSETHLPGVNILI